MKRDSAIHFSILCGFIAFVLSLLVLFISTTELAELTIVTKQLEKEVQQQKVVIEEQNKTIEFYKQYCDDVARCVIEGVW